jgi:hypothetical protein
MLHFSLRRPFGGPRQAFVTPIDSQLMYRHRLERWAAILERNPGELLWLYRNLEVSDVRWLMQDRLSWLERRLGDLPPGLQQLTLGQVTALTIAVDDPELSQAGLRSERYSVVLSFFGLQDEELHRILCFCAYGQQIQAPAGAIAERIRASADALPLRATG